MAERARSREEASPTTTGRATVRRAAGVETNPVALDQLIHGRVRLGIVSALAVEDSLTFNELKDRLEEAGYIEITKSFERRVPRTDYRLTPAGRMALERYLDHMEALIDRVRE